MPGSHKSNQSARGSSASTSASFTTGISNKPIFQTRQPVVRDAAVFVWILSIAVIGNGIACVVFANRYLDASSQLGTPTMLYSTVFIRGLAFFTVAGALLYAVWTFADSRHTLEGVSGKQNILHRLQGPRVFNYQQDYRERTDEEWLKKSQRGRMLAVVISGAFLILWIIPSSLLYAQGWMWKYMPFENASAGTRATEASACRRDQKSDDCTIVASLGISSAFEVIWILFIILITIISLMSKSRNRMTFRAQPWPLIKGQHRPYQAYGVVPFGIHSTPLLPPPTWPHRRSLPQRRRSPRSRNSSVRGPQAPPPMPQKIQPVAKRAMGQQPPPPPPVNAGPQPKPSANPVMATVSPQTFQTPTPPKGLKIPSPPPAK